MCKKTSKQVVKNFEKKIVNYLKQIPISIPHAATHILRFFLSKNVKKCIDDYKSTHCIFYLCTLVLLSSEARRLIPSMTRSVGIATSAKSTKVVYKSIREPTWWETWINTTTEQYWVYLKYIKITLIISKSWFFFHKAMSVYKLNHKC